MLRSVSTLNLRFKKAIAALKNRNDKCYDAWAMLCDGRICKYFESAGRPAVLMNPSTEFDLEVYRNQVMYQYQVLGFILTCHADLGLDPLSRFEICIIYIYIHYMHPICFQCQGIFHHCRSQSYTEMQP